MLYLDNTLFETESSSEGKTTDNGWIMESFLDHNNEECFAYGRIKGIFFYDMPDPYSRLDDPSLLLVECDWYERVGEAPFSLLPLIRLSDLQEWRAKRFQRLKDLWAENILVVPHEGPGHDIGNPESLLVVIRLP